MSFRSSILLGVVVVASVLAGCSGDTSSVLATGGTEPKVAAFNPFSTDPETLTGGREVIASPTLADVMLTGTLPEMSWGRPDAKVTIIKYASLTCPYCRKFQLETFPHFKREYIDTGRVRFIIREFPIGKTSGSATVALRCAPPDKYLALYEKFLTQQSLWVSQEVRPEAIFRVAAQVGVTDTQFSACMRNQALLEQLHWVKERGRKLGVIGTPNFFVNAKLVKSVIGMAEIKSLVEAAEAGPVARTN